VSSWRWVRQLLLTYLTRFSYPPGRCVMLFVSALSLKAQVGLVQRKFWMFA
jgi:hypothetical protein